MVDGEIVSVRIDRTLVDGDGVPWIVDYRTSSHEGADVEAFLDTEWERYRDQLELYRRIFLAMEGRPVPGSLFSAAERVAGSGTGARPGRQGDVEEDLWRSDSFTRRTFT
jgi:hypothetical protein